MSTASSTNSAGSMTTTTTTQSVHSSLASLVASASAAAASASANGAEEKNTNSTSNNGGPSPHRRYHFSPMQTMELNNAFSQNPYPSVKYRQELATRLGIDQKVSNYGIYRIGRALNII